MIGTDTLKKKVQEKMRINVLQHTPNEGPGAIRLWAEENGHELYVYHPYRYGILPDVEETDMLVILGGPMSPNDDFEWLKKERDLIRAAIKHDFRSMPWCAADFKGTWRSRQKQRRQRSRLCTGFFEIACDQRSSGRG